MINACVCLCVRDVSVCAYAPLLRRHHHSSSPHFPITLSTFISSTFLSIHTEGVHGRCKHECTGRAHFTWLHWYVTVLFYLLCLDVSSGTWYCIPLAHLLFHIYSPLLIGMISLFIRTHSSCNLSSWSISSFILLLLFDIYRISFPLP